MNEREQMKLDMVKSLALLLMDNDANMTVEQALATVLNSDTYQRLLEDDTQLYHQSPRYVYSFLDNELKTGTMR